MNSPHLLERFPILREGIYANHAAIAPLPAPVADAVTAFARDFMLNGPKNYPRYLLREARLRRRLARLLNAESADDIALLKNTTEGISMVAGGIDWRAGDNLVLPVGEFPSNSLPWRAQARHGVDIRQVDMRTATDPEAELLNHVDRRTRVLALSAVQWSDGFRLDLERLGSACRGTQTLFFVDAIQQLGALPLDVSAAHVDILAADAHKWLLGPEGIAVFYCRSEARERLRLTQQGWRMYDDPFLFDRVDWTPSATARRFEAGSPNMLGQSALDAALALIFEYGIDVIGQRVLDTTARLVDGLTALPVVISSDTHPRRRSGIVSFRLRDGDTRKFQQDLASSGVASTMRGSAIRLSPHHYQAGETIDRLLEVIESRLGSVR